MLKKFVDGAPRPTARNPGRNVVERIRVSAPKIKVTLEAGVLYRLRRGSSGWFSWGDQLMMAMTSGSYTKGSGVQVMAPSGLIMVVAGDLRPVHGENEEE